MFTMNGVKLQVDVARKPGYAADNAHWPWIEIRSLASPLLKNQVNAIEFGHALTLSPRTKRAGINRPGR